VAALALLPLGAIAQDKPGKGKKVYSVIGGTVFREPGFAFPGVQVELLEVSEGKKRKKPEKTVTDGRGEFAFRMEGRDAKFLVLAAAKGFEGQEKEAVSTPGVRTDVFFTLKPAAP
jgi:hypothetical protein